MYNTKNQKEPPNCFWKIIHRGKPESFLPTYYAYPYTRIGSYPQEKKKRGWLGHSNIFLRSEFMENPLQTITTCFFFIIIIIIIIIIIVRFLWRVARKWDIACSCAVQVFFMCNRP